MTGAATASCGTFPNPGASQTLYRQYVTGMNSATPGSMTVTNSYGTVATLDDQTANLANFDSQTIPTLVNNGYGVQVDYNSSGLRSSVTIAHHMYTSTVDRSIYGTFSVTEGGTSRTVSGTVYVYYNNAQVIGTSTFTNLLHTNLCCLPTQGTITTKFSAGTTKSPTGVGSLLVNKQEILTFTGCGTATLQKYDGTIVNESLTRCY